MMLATAALENWNVDELAVALPSETGLFTCFIFPFDSIKSLHRIHLIILTMFACLFGLFVVVTQ